MSVSSKKFVMQQVPITLLPCNLDVFCGGVASSYGNSLDVVGVLVFVIPPQ